MVKMPLKLCRKTAEFWEVKMIKKTININTFNSDKLFYNIFVNQFKSILALHLEKISSMTFRK